MSGLFGLGTLVPMYSKLAYEIRKSRLAALRRLPLEQRLKARLTHRRLMMKLYEAGKKIREEQRARRVREKELDP